MSTIDCEKLCEDELNKLNDLIKNKGTDIKNKEIDDKIQDATRDHYSCMMNCNNRKDNATRGVGGGGGNRKKYINKTKHRRSSTRSRVRHRRPRTHMNHRKKN